MKTLKLITPLVLVLFIIGCNSEEIQTDNSQADFTINNTETQNPSQERGENFFPCGPINCDLEYEFPELAMGTPGYRIIQVVYKHDMTEDEVICTRHKFFSCFLDLKMTQLQASDIHLDTWAYPLSNNPQGKSNKVLDGSINEDPRTCGNC